MFYNLTVLDKNIGTFNGESKFDAETWLQKFSSMKNLDVLIVTHWKQPGSI